MYYNINNIHIYTIQETSLHTPENDQYDTNLQPPSKLGPPKSPELASPPQGADNLKDMAVSCSDTECVSPLYSVPDKVKLKVN